MGLHKFAKNGEKINEKFPFSIREFLHFRHLYNAVTFELCQDFISIMA